YDISRVANDLVTRVLSVSFVGYQYYPEHLVLHSFPTRRSSDLATGALEPGVIDQRQVPGSNRRCHRRAAELPGRYRTVGHFIERSEEHTSELQSRENLVCRLLLEKKIRIIKSFAR